MFRTVPLSIIRKISLNTQQWYMSYRFADSLRAGSGWNYRLDALISQIYSWIETLDVSDSSSVHHQEFFTVVNVICHTGLLTAVRTVKNFWWWTEELSKTCRVSFQNKFETLLHLGGFIKICHDARSHERKIAQCIFGFDFTCSGQPMTFCKKYDEKVGMYWSMQ
jgi:hypothetical protein